MSKKHTTELARLKRITHDLCADIGFLERPLDGLDDTLSEVDKVLHLPKHAADEVAKIRSKLTTLDKAAGLAADFPVIGNGAKAVVEVLDPMVKIPKPHGGLGEIETLLRDIDKTVLVELKTFVTKIKEPVDKTRSAIAKVHGAAIAFDTSLATLIKKQGNHPSKEIEACAKGIADTLEPPVEALNTANDYLKDKLHEVDDKLSDVVTIFMGVNHVFDAISGVLDYLDSAAFNKFQKQLQELVDKVEGILKKAIKSIAKGLGIDLNKIIGGLKAIENRINGFVGQKVYSVVKKLESSLTSAIPNIPGAKELENKVADIEDAFQRLEREFEQLMASQCSTTLGFLQGSEV